jgi:hypothetical protein
MLVVAAIAAAEAVRADRDMPQFCYNTVSTALMRDEE